MSPLMGRQVAVDVMGGDPGTAAPEGQVCAVHASSFADGAEGDGEGDGDVDSEEDGIGAGRGVEHPSAGSGGGGDDAAAAASAAADGAGPGGGPPQPADRHPKVRRALSLVAVEMGVATEPAAVMVATAERTAERTSEAPAAPVVDRWFDDTEVNEVARPSLDMCFDDTEVNEVARPSLDMCFDDTEVNEVARPSLDKCFDGDDYVRCDVLVSGTRAFCNATIADDKAAATAAATAAASTSAAVEAAAKLHVEADAAAAAAARAVAPAPRAPRLPMPGPVPWPPWYQLKRPRPTRGSHEAVPPLSPRAPSCSSHAESSAPGGAHKARQSAFEMPDVAGAIGETFAQVFRFGTELGSHTTTAAAAIAHALQVPTFCGADQQSPERRERRGPGSGTAGADRVDGGVASTLFSPGGHACDGYVPLDDDRIGGRRVNECASP